MAKVQDALWIRRNIARIRAYCGPAQVGGVLDPMSLVIAIALLAQLREYQGLATYSAATDMKWGFDVAIISGMLYACYRAGVTGRDWLLIDDLMHMDQQVVELHGLLSPIFMLGCGTAQGRSSSLPVFNSLLRSFADELAKAVPGGTCALLPPFAREALMAAAAGSPAASLSAPPSELSAVAALVDRISSMADGDVEPWDNTKRLTISSLESLPKLADRATVLEQLGTHSLGPLQYVDDGTTPCPSVGAVHAVLGSVNSSATSRYAHWAKAQFNMTKSVCLPLFGSPPPDEDALGCAVASIFRILGVSLDAYLTFVQLFGSMLGQGRSSFTSLFNSAESGGFSVPLLAAQVEIRLVPAVLFPAALVITIIAFESRLNRLQHEWARAVLGCRTGPCTNWALSRAQCGWVLRLGTRAIEYAIMAEARIHVLPRDHPAVLMAEAATSSLAYTWLRSVATLRGRVGGRTPIPSLLDFAPAVARLEAARADADERKHVLRRYRWEVVHPALQAYDRECYLRAASRVIVAFGVPFTHFQPLPSQTPSGLLCCDWGSSSWRLYRLWAVCRMTGRWPLPVLGQTELPESLQVCAACGQINISVTHPLLVCPGTLVLHQTLTAAVGSLYRDSQVAFLTAVFGHNAPPANRYQHILYVGKAILTSIASLSYIDQGDDDSTNADSSRLPTERIAMCTRAYEQIQTQELSDDDQT